MSYSTYEAAVNQLYKIRNIQVWLENRPSKEEKLLLKRNVSLKGKLQGKRCFIVGNGPSIAKQDLSLLENEFVITVNQIARCKEFEKLKTNVHFWSDPVFFDENNITNELLEAMKKVNSHNNHPVVFYPLVAKKFIENQKLDKHLNIHYFNPAYRFHGAYKKSIDFTKIVPTFGTVVHAGIILAIYMGASEIYLLGCDCTGILNYINMMENEKQLEYIYETTDVEKMRLKNSMQAFQAEDCFRGWCGVFQQYRFLDKYCTERNIKLVNCSAGGILRNIACKKLETVLKNDKL